MYTVTVADAVPVTTPEISDSVLLPFEQLGVSPDALDGPEVSAQVRVTVPV